VSRSLSTWIQTVPCSSLLKKRWGKKGGGEKELDVERIERKHLLTILSAVAYKIFNVLTQ
jgi:hypothetical protein